MPVAGIIGGIGSIASGILGAVGSNNASQEEVQALQQAEKYLQGQASSAEGNFSPYLSAGSAATGTLADMLATPGKGLLTPWTQKFTAPTAEQAAQTPGYQFQLQQGENALQNSAAARGGLLSGRTLADMNNYAQGVASSNYQNVFNNALTQYQQAYQSFLNNQNNTYSRLMGVSGQGLNAAQGYGATAANFGSDIASLMGQQGAARAAGTLGTYGSLSDMIGNVSSLPMMFSGGGSGAPVNGSTAALPLNPSIYSMQPRLVSAPPPA